jgi:hypothetical protein
MLFLLSVAGAAGVVTESAALCGDALPAASLADTVMT